MKSKATIFEKVSNQCQNLAWPLIVFFLFSLIQSALINKVSVFLFICYLFVLNYKDIFKITLQSFRAYALLLFLLWDISSIGWSVSPMTTLINVGNDVEIIVFSLIAAYQARNKDVVTSLKLVAIIIIIAVIIYSLIFPGDSINASGLKSFFGNKNYFGQTMALSSIFLILTIGRNFKNYIFVVLSVSLLILSQSKSSIALFAFIIFLILVMYLLNLGYQQLSSYTQGFINLMLKTIPMVLYSLIGLLVFFRESVSDYFITTFPYEALTGRGLLWVTVLSRTREDLLIGIGPGAFWAGGAYAGSEISQTAISYEQPWIASLNAADGGYIDIIGALGFIGLGLLLFVIIQSYQFSFREKSIHIKRLSFSLITFFLLHNVTETNVLRFTDSLWFIFVFITFYLVFRQTKAISTNLNNY
jgi:exopolysaccharide production protein ExoQ